MATKNAFRRHFSELSKAIGPFPNLLLSVSNRFYQYSIIDLQIKSDINRSGGEAGASMLLDHVMVKIEQSDHYLSLVMDILREETALADTVYKIERASFSIVPNNQVGSTFPMDTTITDSQHDLIPSPNDSSTVQDTILAAEKLKSSFDSLCLVLISIVSQAEVDLSKLRMLIYLRLQYIRDNTSPEVQEHLKELEECTKAESVIMFLINKNFLGYLNFEILEALKPALSSDEFNGRLEEYQLAHKKFIMSNFHNIVEVFNQRPRLRPASIVGLPEIKVELATPWKSKSLYYWKEVVNSIVDWGLSSVVITRVEFNCISITYQVLPFIIPRVVKDLTNETIMKRFAALEATFTIPDKLLQDGIADNQWIMDTVQEQILLKKTTKSNKEGDNTNKFNETSDQPLEEVHPKLPLKPSRPVTVTGGYDDELFLSPPPGDLQCPICYLTVKEPHQLSCCGATLCQVCSDSINASVQCPCCRNTDHQIMVDKKTRGRVMSLPVKCTVPDCHWIGELLDLKTHLKNKCPQPIVDRENMYMATSEYLSEKDTETDSSDDDDSSSVSSQTMTDQKQCGTKLGGKEQKDRSVVWVGNLPSTCTLQQLLEHFSSYKSYICNEVKIFEPKDTTFHPFTFLHFDTIDEANEVIHAMNNTKLQGNKIIVKLKENKKRSLSSEQKLTIEAVAKKDTGYSTKSHTRPDPSCDSNTVLIFNVPKVIDGDDLKGLVAKFQPVSCSISSPNATLTFSSAELARDALMVLDKKLVCGVSLRATLGESKTISLVGETIYKDPPSPSPLSPNSSSALLPQPSGRNQSMSDGLFPHNPPIPYPTPQQVPHPPLSCHVSTPLMSDYPPGHQPLPPHGHHQPLPPHDVHHQPLPPHGHQQPLPPHGHHQPLPPHGHHQPLPPHRHHQPFPPPHVRHQSLPSPHGIGQQLYNRSYSDGSSITVKESPEKRQRGNYNEIDPSMRLVYNKSLSTELYAILCKSEEGRINDFKRKDGTIDYYQPTSTMIICGPSLEVTALMKQFDRYDERELRFSSHQWNSLVQVDQLGKRQMDEIAGPFLANPAVKITEPQPLKILIVGVKEAVDVAHEHFIRCMNKEIKADSSKIAVLVQLEPDLPQLIHSKYGVTIRGYSVGSMAIEVQDVTDPEDISKIHELLEEKLSSLCCTSVPIVIRPTLITAAKEVCCKDGFPVIVKEEQGQIILWATSLDTLDKAKNVFTRKPYLNKIELSRFNEACLYLSFSEKFTFDSVDIHKEDKTIVFEGYDKHVVQSAKRVVLKFLNETFAKELVETVVEEDLKCSEPQLVYLTRSLQSVNDPEELTKSLPGKVSLKDGKVSIKAGTKEEVSETAEALLNSIPKHSKRTFEGQCNRHLPSLLKLYVLMSIDYIVIKNSKETGNRLMVYLYENNSDALAEVEEKLDAIDPCVSFFTVNPKAKNVVKKMLSDLERQERCRIDLMKLDTPGITIHGLTQKENDHAKTAIEDYISENYNVVGKIPSPHVTGLQMKYVLSKHSEKIKELGKGLKQCNIPYDVVHKSPFDIQLDPSVYIKIFGPSKAIDAFKDAILSHFSSNFAFEKFEVRLQNFFWFPWRARWDTLKQKAEATQAIIMEYRLPARREDRDGPIQFIMYGNQSEDIRRLRETVESEIAAGTTETKIKLKKTHVRQVQVALRNKELNFDNYLVNVSCVEKDKMIYVNSLAIADCTELVKAEIIEFLECTDTTSDTTSDTGCKEIVLEFDDSLLYAVFLSENFSFFSDASAIAKKVNVCIQSGVSSPNKIPSICLSGSKVAAVNTVKRQIDVLINDKIKPIIDTKQIHVTVDSLLQCALTPAVKSNLEKKLQEEYCVHIISYQSTKLNRGVRQQMQRTVSIKLSCESPVIKLSFVKASSVEDLSSQSTDVIVIPTSTDLQHVNPVAKDVFNKGGPILKKECDNYLQKTGKMAIGEVVMTGSGCLKCRSVVHAAIPVWNRGQTGEREAMYAAVFDSLSKSSGYSSVCLPALGCDNHFKIPVDVCAEMSLRAIRDFCICLSSSSLKELTFILLEDDAQRSFMDAISTVFPSESLISDSVDTTDSTSSSPLSLTTPTSTVSWYWTNDSGKQTPYNPTESDKLEAMYQMKSPHMTEIGGQLYHFDFEQMIQINESPVSGSGVRKILRKVQTKQTSPTTEASSFPIKLSQIDSIMITLRGPITNLQASENEVRRYLKQVIKEEHIQLTSKKVDQNSTYELENGTEERKQGVNVDKAVNKP